MEPQRSFLRTQPVALPYSVSQTSDSPAAKLAASASPSKPKRRGKSYPHSCLIPCRKSSAAFLQDSPREVFRCRPFQLLVLARYPREIGYKWASVANQPDTKARFWISFDP